MKEIIEFRIDKKYAGLLFHPEEGQDLGDYQVIKISKDDPKYEKIGFLRKEIEEKYNDFFFLYWDIKRKYSKKELDVADLLHLIIKTTFEPTGEECGTLFDETMACEICGANRKQAGPLILKQGKIPKKDIARTIGGEVVVSEKFVNMVKQRNIKGLQLRPINVENYYQLTAIKEIELSSSTLVGLNPFDLSTRNEDEIYKCPKGHTIGLNLLSEPYVLDSQAIGEYDFLASKQKVGVKRGMLRPEPIYLCSQAFRKMVEEEKLSGFKFEVGNIEFNYEHQYK